MRISELMIELTRKCNMRCDHCIRGASQKESISIDMIEDFLDKLEIEDVGMLMFTGGEPSLYPEEITKTVELLKSKNITYSGFFIATNALSSNKDSEFLVALASLYAYAEEKEMCSVRISRDEYHVVETDKKMDELLSAFSFVEIDDSQGYELFNDGLAKEFGLYEAKKTYELESVELQINSYTDTISIEISEPIYLATNGKIGIGCNFSYKRFDEEIAFTSIDEVSSSNDFVKKLCKHADEENMSLELDEDVEKLVA